MSMEVKTAIKTIVKNNRGTSLYIAPIGAGKTRFVWELAFSISEPIVFISPLRSIINELSELKGSINFGGDRESKRGALLKFKQESQSILLLTPESLTNEIWIALKNMRPLFVIDEFQLFYIWGKTFRDKLRGFIEELYLDRHKILGLSATISEDVLKEIELDHVLCGSNLIKLDLGNFKLRNEPRRIKKVSIESFWKFVLIKVKLLRKRTIVFVRTRREVEHYVLWLKKKGVYAIGCVGGETKEFLRKFQSSKYDVIVSTSVLSHGVNLGLIENVCLSYSPEEYLRIQMIGRGGRTGKPFTVIEIQQELEFKDKLFDQIVHFLSKVVSFVL